MRALRRGKMGFSDKWGYPINMWESENSIKGNKNVAEIRKEGQKLLTNIAPANEYTNKEGERWKEKKFWENII